MRDSLRDVYSVLKDADKHLRFVFITGVSIILVGRGFSLEARSVVGLGLAEGLTGC